MSTPIFEGCRRASMGLIGAVSLMWASAAAGAGGARRVDRGYFPKGGKVVSVFSGNRLAVEGRLGCPVVAIDGLPRNEPAPKGVTYVSAFLPRIEDGKTRSLGGALSKVRARRASVSRISVCRPTRIG